MRTTIQALALSLIAVLIILLSILPQYGCNLEADLIKECAVGIEPYVEPDITWAYEGPVNPNEFGEWDCVADFPTDIWGYHWYIIKNPDPDSEVEFVEVLINLFIPTMPGYRFWIGNEPYTYFVTEDGKGYENDPLTEQEKQSCMSCHQDKAKPINPVNRSI